MKIGNGRLIFGAAMMLLCGNAACADMTLVRRATFDNPKFERLGLATVSEAKILISGGKTRVEETPLCFIYDKDNRRSLLLNSARKTCFASSYSEQKPRAETSAADAKTTSEATLETKTILGHVCRRYHLTLTSRSPHVGDVAADVYSAQDLPSVDVFSMSRGPAWIFHDEFQKLPGMPLQVTMTQTSQAGGRTKIEASVVSLRLAPLPASVFVIPGGYQIVAPPPPPRPPAAGGNASRDRKNKTHNDEA